MSEGLLSLIIIFAQLGGVLLLLALGWAIYFIYATKKDGKCTRELIEYVKTRIPAHRDQLTEYFNNEFDLDKSKVDQNIETLIKGERRLYDQLIKVSISRDTELLKTSTDDINSLINDYVRLLALKAGVESDDDKGSRDLKLKKENEALRLENASLTKRLDSATETIENMMGEFSSMYEGGKKEGEQRVKNEMYKLQQSLKTEQIQSKTEIDELEKKEAESKEE